MEEKDIIICPKCGKEVKSDKKFCIYCGYQFQQTVNNVEDAKDTASTEVNQKENDTDEVNTQNEKSSKVSKMVWIILSSVVVLIIIISILIFKLVNDTKPLVHDGVIGNGEVGLQISTKYSLLKREATIFYNFKLNTEEWQKDYCFDNNCKSTIKLSFSDNTFRDGKKYNLYSCSIANGSPLSLTFLIDNIMPWEYKNLKDLILDNKMIIWEIDFFVTDKKAKEKIRKDYLKEKAERELELEIMDIARTYAHIYENSAEIPLNENPRKCLFKTKGVCFGHPFIPKPLNIDECFKDKKKLGINTCELSTDYWAGAAKVCGGVKNLPTPEELLALAKDMYYISEEYIKRQDDKYFLDYFRKTQMNNHLSDDGFIVYSKNETSYSTIGARNFMLNDSGYDDNYLRTYNGIVGICVIRNK